MLVSGQRPQTLPSFVFEMPKVKLRDAEIFYELSGEGDPLVLVPGFASGAWSWEQQAGDLSRTFTVITFDPRGVSHSAVNDGAKVSIETIADDVAALLDFLSFESSNILGISFGGFVAQAFALKFPQKLKKLILASTSFGGVNHVAPPADVLSAFASTGGLNSTERIRSYLAMAFTPEFALNDPVAVDRFCSLRETNHVSEEVYLQQLRSAMSFDVESRLGNLSAETLVVTGDRDAVVPMQNSVNLASAIPKARLAMIEGAGHMAFIERADEFNAIVKDFLI